MKKSELKEIIKSAMSEDTMHESAEKWNKLSNDQKLDLLLQAYKDPDEAEEYVDYTWNELPDVATQNMRLEEAEEEDIEVDAEEEVTVDDTEEEIAPELEGDTQDVLTHLESALEAARAKGDEKLINQIGNTITFFTRQYVVKEEDLFEIKRMKRLAGILK